MEKFLPILRKCPLFAKVDDGDIPGMLGCLTAVIKEVKKNQFIFSEGEPAVYVGILLDGSAHVEKQDFYGNRSIVSSVAPGDLFAESFACAGVTEMPVSVVAVEDSKVMLIPCQRITVGCANACAHHSQMIYNLLQIVAVKNLEFHRKLEITANRTTREKLLAYLQLQAKEKGSSTFSIPYDRQGLADYLGVERSAMSAELGKLRRDGVIDFSRSKFTLL